MNFPDGGIYKGKFKNDQINGHGEYIWPEGISYTGQWVNCRKDGEGVLKWADKSREYRGHFKEDMRHGYGEYTWEHGRRRFKGNWKHGLQDGVGFVLDHFDFVEKKGLWL